MKYKNTIIAILLLQLFSHPVHSEIYKWIDENGQVHYGDKPKNKKKSKKVPYKAPPKQNSAPTTENIPARTAEQMANDLRQERYQKANEKRRKAAEKRKKEYRQLCDKAAQDERRLHRELEELDRQQFHKRTAERNEIVKQKRSELSEASRDRFKYCR